MNENANNELINEEETIEEKVETKVIVKTKYPAWLVILCVLFFVSTVIFAVTLHHALLYNESMISKEGKLIQPSDVSSTLVKKDLNYYKKRYGKVDEIRDFVEKYFYKEVSDEDFKEGVIRGLFSALDDPYSTYFSAKEYKEFNELNEGSYGGLGITISPSKSGYITVISTFEDTPASRAGILHDDKIIKVNGTEYGADKMDLAVSKMKGKPGTKVNITILRGEEEIDLDLERAEIVIQSVKSEIVDENPKIGYIRIRSFDQKVSEEFEEHYNELKAQGMEAFVLDLRSNPGGSLAECVKVSDFILGEQRIVSTKDKAGHEQVFDSDKSKVDLPFIVLINGASASASEILSAAIQDGKAAQLLGTNTFGKGVVQTVIPLSDSSAFKVTTSEYFTPKGENIHEKGIKPDIELELSEDFKMEDRTTDNQLNKGIEILKKEINK